MSSAGQWPNLPFERRSFVVSSSENDTEDERVFFNDYRGSGVPSRNLGTPGDTYIDISGSILYAFCAEGWTVWPGPANRSSPIAHPTHAAFVLWCNIGKKRVVWVEKTRMKKILVSAPEAIKQIISAPRKSLKRKAEGDNVNPLKKPRIPDAEDSTAANAAPSAAKATSPQSPTTLPNPARSHPHKPTPSQATPASAPTSTPAVKPNRPTKRDSNTIAKKPPPTTTAKPLKQPSSIKTTPSLSVPASTVPVTAPQPPVKRNRPPASAHAASSSSQPIPSQTAPISTPSTSNPTPSASQAAGLAWARCKSVSAAVSVPLNSPPPISLTMPELIPILDLAAPVQPSSVRTTASITQRKRPPVITNFMYAQRSLLAADDGDGASGGGKYGAIVGEESPPTSVGEDSHAADVAEADEVDLALLVQGNDGDGNGVHQQDDDLVAPIPTSHPPAPVSTERVVPSPRWHSPPSRLSSSVSEAVPPPAPTRRASITPLASHSPPPTVSRTSPTIPPEASLFRSERLNAQDGASLSKASHQLDIKRRSRIRAPIGPGELELKFLDPNLPAANPTSSISSPSSASSAAFSNQATLIEPIDVLMVNTHMSALQREVEVLKREAELLKDVNGALTAERDALGKERDVLWHERNTLAKARDTAQTRSDDLLKQYAELIAQKDTLLRANHSLSKDKRALASTLQTAQEGNEAFVAQNVELRQRVDQLFDERTYLDRVCTQLKKGYTEQGVVRQSEYTELLNRAAALETSNRFLVGVNESLQLRVDASADTMETLRQALGRLRQENHELKGKLLRKETRDVATGTDALSPVGTMEEEENLHQERGNALEFQPWEEHEMPRESPGEDNFADTVLIKEEPHEDIQIGNAAPAPVSEVIDLTMDSDDEENSGDDNARAPSMNMSVSGSTSVPRTPPLSPPSPPLLSDQVTPPRRSSPQRDRPFTAPSALGLVVPMVGPSLDKPTHFTISGTEFDKVQLMEIVVQNGGGINATDPTWGKILALLRLISGFPVTHWGDAVASLKSYYIGHLLHLEGKPWSTPDRKARGFRPGGVQTSPSRRAGRPSSRIVAATPPEPLDLSPSSTSTLSDTPTDIFLTLPTPSLLNPASPTVSAPSSTVTDTGTALLEAEPPAAGEPCESPTASETPPPIVVTGTHPNIDATTDGKPKEPDPDTPVISILEEAVTSSLEGFMLPEETSTDNIRTAGDDVVTPPEEQAQTEAPDTHTPLRLFPFRFNRTIGLSYFHHPAARLRRLTPIHLQYLWVRHGDPPVMACVPCSTDGQEFTLPATTDSEGLEDHSEKCHPDVCDQISGISDEELQQMLTMEEEDP
ncbi:hypothetical protein C8R43DRAFT_977874 [Mycena crocata]|nr:hypothetical protein C8R43DRAFT_977874 [Mycena crocata]